MGSANASGAPRSGSRWRNLTIRQKLVGGALGVVAVCTVVGAVSFLVTLDRVSEGNLDFVIANATATAKAIRDDSQRRVDGYASILSRQPEIGIAVVGGNVDALEEMLTTEYQALKDLDQSVTEVQVTGRDGQVVMRGQDPARRGGDLSGNPLVRRGLTGEPASGLTVVADTRQIAHQAVAPLRFGHQVVGTLTVGSQLGQDTADFIKDKTKAEIMFLVDGKVQASTLHGAATAGGDVENAVTDLLRGGSERYAEVTLGGESFQAGQVPFLDGQGKVAAVMVVLVSRGFVDRARTSFLLAYLGTILLSTAIVAVGVVSFSRRLAHPLQVLSSLAQDIAAGDLRRQDVQVDTDDDVGRRVAGMTEAVERIRVTVESIAESAGRLSESAAQQATISEQMLHDAEGTSVQAIAVSAAAEQVSVSMTTAATAVDEMNVSIREIAHNANTAAGVATTAVDLVERATTAISRLGESSSQIGQVVSLITSIAEQTKLLGLNATIESARAGEAGRGFAVVASEVKELAKQTATATQDIEPRIAAIQSDVATTVQAIGEIRTIMNHVNDIQSIIATSVEEQTATTAEIGRSVSEAANGGRAIAQNVVEVVGVAEQTSSRARASQGAAQEMSELATSLQRLVSQFRV